MGLTESCLGRSGKTREFGNERADLCLARGDAKMKLYVRLTRNTQGGFTASCPSLPGCTSCGDTREDACDKLDEAIRGYIAAVNNFVPEHVNREVVEV